MRYETRSLGKYIDIISGYAFKSKDFISTGIPIIKIKNITSPEVSLDDLSYIPVEIANSLPKFELSHGDVLIALTGSHINQMASVVGRVARVKYNTRSMLNQRVGKIVVTDTDACNLDYVYYYLSQDQVKISLARKAGGAANQANISPSDVKGLEIPFPSIEIQRRIADILSAYDDLLENNQKQIKLLEEAAMRLYKEWFLNLRFPGHENTPIVDGVPEGWEKSTFESLCTLIKDGVTPKNITSETPYIGLEHIPRKSFCLNEWNNTQNVNSNKFRFIKNDVLFGKIRPYFHKVGFAITDGVCSTDTMVFRAKEDMFGLLLMTAFSEAFVNHSYQTCKEGSKMPRADWNEMKQYPIMIPNETILKEFNKKIGDLTDLVHRLCKQILLLKQARDKLLPKLMNGQIEL